MTGFETKKQMESKGKDGKMDGFSFQKACPMAVGDALGIGGWKFGYFLGPA